MFYVELKSERVKERDERGGKKRKERRRWAEATQTDRRHRHTARTDWAVVVVDCVSRPLGSEAFRRALHLLSPLDSLAVCVSCIFSRALYSHLVQFRLSFFVVHFLPACVVDRIRTDSSVRVVGSRLLSPSKRATTSKLSPRNNVISAGPLTRNKTVAACYFSGRLECPSFVCVTTA